MQRAIILKGVLIATTGLFGSLAHAGAWSPQKGTGLVILKYEQMDSTSAFEDDGSEVAFRQQRTDRTVSVWTEYGLSDKLTAIGRTDWQKSHDDYYDLSAQGPVELGLRYRLAQGRHGVMSVQASHAWASDARLTPWAPPGVGTYENEVRLLAGRSLGGRRPGYIEGQVARRWRDGLPDEVRLQATLGMDISLHWSMQTQMHYGRTEKDRNGGHAEWTRVETSLLRHHGPWSFQAGWQSTVDGNRVPYDQGPVVAIWRRF